MSTETKPSNPKDAIGSKKLPMELVPDTINVEVALAFLEGALKYGRFNWRIAGVRSSIYAAAMKRHQAKWWNGENEDRATRVKHLASVIACAGILLDAELCGKLEDDRPPMCPISDLIDRADVRVAHLTALFAAHNPKQYTIDDSPQLYDGPIPEFPHVDPDQAESQRSIAQAIGGCCGDEDPCCQTGSGEEFARPGDTKARGLR